MPSFIDVTNGINADASTIQQVVDALKGTAGKGIPLSPTAINDAVNFALAVKNAESGASKTAIFYKADGTVLLQVDKNGVIASPDGVAGAAPLVTTTSTQTISNKSLTSPTVTGTVAGGAIYTTPHMTAPVVDSGGLAVSTSDITGRRYRGAGIALVIGDFVLSAGWGSTASVAVTSGSTDARGQITVTPAGSGIGANPTITMTYKDGTWTTAPFPVVVRQGGSGTGADLATTSSTATLLVIQFLGTPVSGLTHAFSWQVVG